MRHKPKWFATSGKSPWRERLCLSPPPLSLSAGWREAMIPGASHIRPWGEHENGYFAYQKKKKNPEWLFPELYGKKKFYVVYAPTNLGFLSFASNFS